QCPHPRGSRQGNQRSDWLGEVQEPGAPQVVEQRDRRSPGTQGYVSSAIARPGRQQDLGSRPPVRVGQPTVPGAVPQPDPELLSSQEACESLCAVSFA